MRVLFYLPLIRPWAFENMIGPLIAKLSLVAEVHLLLPDPWLRRCTAADKPPIVNRFANVHWHAADTGEAMGGEGAAADRDRLLERVRAIDPQYCLCRCVDESAAAGFPGEIRFIMEAAAPPFPVPGHWITLPRQMFAQGSIAELNDQEGALLEALIAPGWAAMEESLPWDPSWLAQRGIPVDRKIVALPLEYDRPENLFAIHRVVRPNHALVTAIADRLSPPLFLALTDHPNNGRDPELLDVLERRKSIARLLPAEDIRGDVTVRLTQHADAMIVGDSKSFAAAAFHGKPMLRLSKFESAPWLHAARDMPAFVESLLSGAARAPERAEAMRWFAFYLANEAFGPRDAEVDSAEIVARLERPIDPARWATAFRRCAIAVEPPTRIIGAKL